MVIRYIERELATIRGAKDKGQHDKAEDESDKHTGPNCGSTCCPGARTLATSHQKAATVAMAAAAWQSWDTLLTPIFRPSLLGQLGGTALGGEGHEEGSALWPGRGKEEVTSGV